MAAHDARLLGPRLAWDKAVSSLFPNQKASQNKGCPRNAFLGLCDAGVVKGISSGSYSRSIQNKEYALEALKLLRTGAEVTEPIELWAKISGGEQKTYNYQCHVVLALWNEGLIE